MSERRGRRRHASWGDPVGGPPDAAIAGDDRALASWVGTARADGGAPLVRFDASADADLARAVGLVGNGTGTVEVALDAIAVRVADATRADDPGAEAPGADDLAVNAVVVGVAPDRLRWWHRRRTCSVALDGRPLFAGRATTVLIANGQFLRGHDVVPAGHPGDGRLEVQVYALDPAERRPMRGRLRGAAHLPHPRIVARSGREVEVRTARGRPLELDGHRAHRPGARARRRRGPTRMVATVRPAAYRLVL